MKPKRLILLEEAAKQCQARSESLLYYIREEWVVPAAASPSPMEAPGTPLLLDEEDVARAKLIQELQSQFGVNDESIPIILHLLDQLHGLHCEIRRRSDSQKK